MPSNNITILIPVIRPEKAERCIAAIKQNAGIDVSQFRVIAWVDTERVGCPWMIKCMTAYALANERWPWVCFLGDDTIPGKDFLKIALAYAAMFPDGWGMVGFNDQLHVGGYPATHWLAHKKLLPFLGGEFFSTEYIHCYCDRELTDRAMGLDRYIWADQAMVFHDHPIINKQPLTGDYKRVYSPTVKMKDFETYHRRKRKGWQT